MSSAGYFYTSVIGFLVGVASGSVVSVPLPFLALGTIVLVGLALVSCRYRFDARVPALLLGLFLCLLGWWRIDQAFLSVGQSLLEQNVGQEITLYGVVVREPDVRERSTHLTVRTLDTDTLVLVSIDKYQSVAYGDRLSIRGTINHPESFETDLGRIFNYPSYLLVRGIEYQIRYPEVEVLARGEGLWFINKLLLFKRAFLDGLSQVVPEPAFGLGAGMLLGAKQALGDDLETVFRKSGLVHLIVLSGFNLSVVAIAVMTALSLVLPLRPRVVVGIVALVLFALMVGFSATVLRATLMAVLSLWALASGRQYLVLRALCVAVVAMVAWNPLLLLYDVGFQLSCLATLGLIVVGGKTNFQSEWSLKTALRQLFLATVAAQVAVTPLLLYHIGEFSLVSLPANLLVLPLVAAAMLATFVTGVCALLLPTLATLFAYPTTFLLTYIIEQARFWSTLSLATVSVSVFPWWAVLVSYALLGAFVWYWYRNDNLAVQESEVDLSSWTIVTEPDEVPGQQKAAAGSRSEPAAADLPVFFR